MKSKKGIKGLNKILAGCYLDGTGCHVGQSLKGWNLAVDWGHGAAAVACRGGGGSWPTGCPSGLGSCHGSGGSCGSLQVVVLTSTSVATTLSIGEPS